MTICSTCQGRRVRAEMVPEVKRSQGLDYHTGRQVERLHVCDACQGTGRQPEPEPPAPAGLITYYSAILLDLFQSRGLLYHRQSIDEGPHLILPIRGEIGQRHHRLPQLGRH